MVVADEGTSAKSDTFTVKGTTVNISEDIAMSCGPESSLSLVIRILDVPFNRMLQKGTLFSKLDQRLSSSQREPSDGTVAW